jgi:hypothetical protein
MFRVSIWNVAEDKLLLCYTDEWKFSRLFSSDVIHHQSQYAVHLTLVSFENYSNMTFFQFMPSLELMIWVNEEICWFGFWKISRDRQQMMHASQDFTLPVICSRIWSSVKGDAFLPLGFDPMTSNTTYVWVHSVLVTEIKIVSFVTRVHEVRLFIQIE